MHPGAVCASAWVTLAGNSLYLHAGMLPSSNHLDAIRIARRLDDSPNVDHNSIVN